MPSSSTSVAPAEHEPSVFGDRRSRLLSVLTLCTALGTACFNSDEVIDPELETSSTQEDESGSEEENTSFDSSDDSSDLPEHQTHPTFQNWRIPISHFSSAALVMDRSAETVYVAGHETYVLKNDLTPLAAMIEQYSVLTGERNEAWNSNLLAGVMSSVRGIDIDPRARIVYSVGMNHSEYPKNKQVVIAAQNAADGDLLWSKNTPGNERVGVDIVVHEAGLTILTEARSALDFSLGRVIECDKNGNEQWATDLLGEGAEDIHVHSLDRRGNTLLVTGLAQQYIQGFATDRDLIAWTLDEEGKILHEYRLDTDQHTQGFTGLIAPEGHFYVGGQITSSPPSNLHQAFLLALDPQNTNQPELWEYTFSSSGGTGALQVLMEGSDSGSVIVAGGRNIEDQGPYIAQFNTNQTPGWELEVPSTDNALRAADSDGSTICSTGGKDKDYWLRCDQPPQ